MKLKIGILILLIAIGFSIVYFINTEQKRKVNNKNIISDNVKDQVEIDTSIKDNLEKKIIKIQFTIPLKM